MEDSPPEEHIHVIVKLPLLSLEEALSLLVPTQGDNDSHTLRSHSKSSSNSSLNQQQSSSTFANQQSSSNTSVKQNNYSFSDFKFKSILGERRSGKTLLCEFCGDMIALKSADLSKTPSYVLEEMQKEVEICKDLADIQDKYISKLVCYGYYGGVLKQRIVELEAKNAELEAEKAELLKRIMEENTRRDVRVEELEQKNKELETRLVIVKQASLPVEEQTYNDNLSDNSTSNFNSVTEYHEKPLVDVETDNSFPEVICYNKQELVATVPANSAKRLNGKPLEEKDMDSFLLEAHKKIVSSKIKQRNKEKKFLRKSANQDSISDTAYILETVVVAPQLVIADTPQEEIPTVDSKVTHDIKAVNRYPENSYEDVHQMSLKISEEFKKTVSSGNDQSHVTSVKPDLEVSMEQDDEQESLDKNQIIEQGLIQELCGTFDTCSPISSDDNISSNTNSSCNGSENMILGSAQHLSYLFDTAIKSGQQEILDWYNYSLEFESRVNALTADGRIKDKMARSKIYKEMKPFLSAKITQDNLRKKTLRARKHLTLFGKNVSWDRQNQVGLI
ncbi:kinase-like domain-containing protein [Rhizophagus irregularis DAOM 181602=DAOM 197198]|nr:kinase-like domain-containing protein [Rhizophagus irregularis DAOM 181602=DAOM 197198]